MELKDILTRLDVPKELVDDLTEDKFNDFLEGKWISREAAKSDKDLYSDLLSDEKARITGSITTSLKRNFKELGIDVETKDKEGKNLTATEIAESGLSSLGITMKELKDSANSDADEKLTKVNNKLETITLERDEFKTSAEDAATAMEKMKGDNEKTLTGMKIEMHIDSAKNGLAFKDDITDMEKKGFNSILSDYNYTLNEDGNVEVTDKDNKPIFNENKTERLSISQTFEKVAKENKLIKQNNAKPGGRTEFTPPEGGGNQLHQAYEKKVKAARANVS